MSVVHVIDTLTDWARQNVCEKIKLKVPPENDLENDEGYAYKLATPAAFGMYTPTSEKLPPNIHSPFPSVCVRFTSGEDTPSENSGSLDVQMCFSTWDTGLHGKDIYHVKGDKVAERWTGAEADAYFKRSGEGWRDAWNFVDIALRAIESATHIGGYTIDRETPIKFGPLTEQEEIPDFYPFWFAWISFRVNYPLLRYSEDIQIHL